MDASAEVKADVQIKPRGSQVFLVSSIGLSALTISFSAWLLSDHNPAGYLFAGLGTIFAFMCFPLWWRSQIDVDQGSPHPTTIALGNGTSITMDSRYLVSGTAIGGLAKIVEVFNRQPLPSPDGYVDANKQIIPGSLQNATAEVDALNLKTGLVTNQVIELLDIKFTSPDTQFATVPNQTKEPE